ncbi:Neuferricin [Mactra antiquata]
MITKIFLLGVLGIVIALLLTTDYVQPIVNSFYSLLPFLSSSIIGTNVGKLLTKSELAQHNGKQGSSIYLAILGDVFDVSAGKRHYGEGGGYHFFTGKDATRAFVSGDFTDKGLIEDTDGLTHSDILGIEEWNEFYKSNYKHIGRVIGHFYDKNGMPTEAWRKFKDQLKDAKKNKMSEEDDRNMFPPCNFEYKQDWGRRLWCSTLSGGVKRDWAGVPRQYFQPGKSEPRCACVRDKGPPAGSEPSSVHSNRGDLDNPLMKLYEGCKENSFECFFKE